MGISFFLSWIELDIAESVIIVVRSNNFYRHSCESLGSHVDGIHVTVGLIVGSSKSTFFPEGFLPDCSRKINQQPPMKCSIVRF